MEKAGNTEANRQAGETAIKYASDSSSPSLDSIVQLKQANQTMFSLKTIAENQQKWRTISSGYQNFIEFGELPIHIDGFTTLSIALHCQFQMTAMLRLTSGTSCLHGAFSRGSVAGDEHRRQLSSQQCTMFFEKSTSCLVNNKTLTI